MCGSQAATPLSDAQIKSSLRKEAGTKSTSPNHLPSRAFLCDKDWPLSEGDRRLAQVTQAHCLGPVSVAGGIHSLNQGLGAAVPIWGSVSLHSQPAGFVRPAVNVSPVQPLT